MSYFWEREQKKEHRRKRTGYIIIALSAVFFFFVIGDYGVLNWLRLTRQNKALQTEIAHLQTQNSELKEQKHRLLTDQEFIEKIAREQYGFARKGEKVYRFVETH